MDPFIYVCVLVVVVLCLLVRRCCVPCAYAIVSGVAVPMRELHGLHSGACVVLFIWVVATRYAQRIHIVVAPCSPVSVHVVVYQLYFLNTRPYCLSVSISLTPLVVVVYFNSRLYVAISCFNS